MAVARVIPRTPVAAARARRAEGAVAATTRVEVVVVVEEVEVAAGRTPR
jgi:hypothetical protein